MIVQTVQVMVNSIVSIEYDRYLLFGTVPALFSEISLSFAVG